MGGLGHFGEGETLHVATHQIAGLFPNGKEYTLAFVVAGAVLMGFTEVTERDWSVYRRNDFGEPDLGCGAGEHVSAADAALGPDETGAFECQQDLFEVWLGKAGASGNVGD